MATFEERITAARKERGITQEQLAEAMNVSRQTVSHWENGRVKPDEETIKRLSEYLKLDDGAEIEQEEAAVKDAPKASKPIVRLLAAFVCGVLVTLLVVYGLLPLLTKQADSIPTQAAQEQTVLPADYPFEWYQQPATNEAGKAYLKLTPDQAPVKLMPSTDPNREYKWNIVFFIEETNNVPFTVTKFTETFFNSEQGIADVYVKTGAECTRFWQTAMFQSGQGYGYNVGRYADGCIGYGAALEGIDANGNELAFGLYIPLSQEMEKVFTPADFQQEAARDDNKAYIEIVPDNDPIPLIENAEFSGGKGWEYLFTIRNTSDVAFTFHQLTEVEFGGETVLYKGVFTAEQTECETLSKDGEPLLHNGGVGLQDATGIGILVEGTDANGNELSFTKYVAFAQE